MSAEKESLGKIMVGYGTSMQKELEVEAFIQITFPDNRLICVSRIEDGSICTTVENPISSGRQPQQSIWLSKESFVGMITAANLYLLKNGEDVQVLLNEYMKGKEINYSCSQNLNPDNEQ